MRVSNARTGRMYDGMGLQKGRRRKRHALWLWRVRERRTGPPRRRLSGALACRLLLPGRLKFPVNGAIALDVIDVLRREYARCHALWLMLLLMDAFLSVLLLFPVGFLAPTLSRILGGGC